MTPLPTDLGFAALFNGRRDAIGSGAGPITRREVTVIDYYEHLQGKGDGIGIFPLLDDGTCWWGCIDLDEPNFRLAYDFQALLPGDAWVEQSRSGNAHVWVFFTMPAPAWAVRAVLRYATTKFERPDVEIFPKQDAVRTGGVGNFVNLPYHGLSRPMLAWVSASGSLGEPLAVQDFVKVALGSRQEPATWVRLARRTGALPPEERLPMSDWGDRPVLHECAAHIIEGALSGERPLRPGHRHQVLFYLSCQLLNYRDMEASEALALVTEVGQTCRADQREVDRLFRNAYEGQYRSTGCDDPLMRPYVLPDCPILTGGL